MQDFITAIHTYKSCNTDVDMFVDFMNESPRAIEFGFYLHVRKSVQKKYGFVLRNNIEGLDHLDLLTVEVAHVVARELLRNQEENQILAHNSELFQGPFARYHPTNVFGQFTILLEQYYQVDKSTTHENKKVPVRPNGHSTYRTPRPMNTSTASIGPVLLFSDFMHLLIRFRTEHQVRYLRFHWCRERFENVDSNHDEFITLDEFVEAMSHVQPLPAKRELCLIYHNTLLSCTTDEMSYRVYLATVSNMVQNGLVQMGTFKYREDDDDDDNDQDEGPNDQDVKSSEEILKTVAMQWSAKQGQLQGHLAALQARTDAASRNLASEVLQKQMELQHALMSRKKTKVQQIAASTRALAAYKSMMCLLLSDAQGEKSAVDVLKLLEN